MIIPPIVTPQRGMTVRDRFFRHFADALSRCAANKLSYRRMLFKEMVECCRTTDALLSQHKRVSGATANRSADAP